MRPMTNAATAPMHEAYLKLVDQNRATWKNRAHFSTVGSAIDRRILVQHAPKHSRDKRGGKLEKLYLDQTPELWQEHAPDFGALDDALEIFSESFPRETQVVVLKFILPARGQRAPPLVDREICSTRGRSSQGRDYDLPGPRSRWDVGHYLGVGTHGDGASLRRVTTEARRLELQLGSLSLASIPKPLWTDLPLPSALDYWSPLPAR